MIQSFDVLFSEISLCIPLSCNCSLWIKIFQDSWLHLYSFLLPLSHEGDYAMCRVSQMLWKDQWEFGIFCSARPAWTLGTCTCSVKLSFFVFVCELSFAVYRLYHGYCKIEWTTDIKIEIPIVSNVTFIYLL